MVDHYFPQIPVKMESNRNSPIFRLKKSKVVEPSRRYVAVTKFGLLGSFLFPLTKSDCLDSIESSEGNETLGSHSEWSLTCYSSIQTARSRSSGGCSAGDGRDIKMMNRNTTQGRSGETDEIQIYLPGFYESTRPYPLFQTVITVPNAPLFGVEPQLRNDSIPRFEELVGSIPYRDTLSTSVELQSGNELLNTHSSPPPPVLLHDKLFSSETPAREKRCSDNRNLLEDWKVPDSKKFKCKCCLKLLSNKQKLKDHISSLHSEKAKELGLRHAEHCRCNICGKFNSSRSDWSAHMLRRHHIDAKCMGLKSIPELSTTHLEHESGNVETSHNLSSTSVESQLRNDPLPSLEELVGSIPYRDTLCTSVGSQSGNELLNSHSSPPPPVLLPDKLFSSETPARRKPDKRNLLEDWKVPGSKKFKCKCCLKCCSSRMHWWNHMLRKHPAEAKAMCEKSTSFVDPDPCYEDCPVIPV